MTFLRFVTSNRTFLGAGAMLAFASSFGQTFFIAVFAGQIRDDFGLTNGGWGAIYTLGTTLSAATMLWAGTLTDRYRVRGLGRIVLVLLALACVLMASARSVWLLAAAIFALRFLGQGMTSQIAIVAMARWFTASRGRALSIAMLGTAAGEALLPVSFAGLLLVLPWRALWLVSAGALLLMLPFLARLLAAERTPQSAALQDETTGMVGRHWTRGEMLRDLLFWMTVPALLGPPAFGTAFFFHQVHIAASRGWSHLGLVQLFPVYTLTWIAAMLLTGWAVDRFGARKLMPFYQLATAAGFLVFAASGSLSGAALGLVLIGVSAGGGMTIPATFWAESYGTRHLGAIKAVAAAVMVLGSALGPGLTGWIIDRGTPFVAQMPYMALWFALSSLLVGIGLARSVPARQRRRRRYT